MADQTSITQYQTGFAEEIAPYAQALLGQTAALTDTETNPYMQYQGERIAQFSPLQNQSYQNMALMQTQPQLQDATALAGMAGLGALNTQYTFDPSNFNKAFSAATTRDAQGNVTGNTMMNPYMQNVVERQQQDAARQAAIAGQAQQAQAARSGAFGGSGDYLMRGQAASNLARQKGDIQAQGLNTAYNQAMQQYNTQNQQNAQQQQYGAGLGLQGLQMANQSAQNLGTLGNLQYQQNMGINQQQNQYGLQQQAQVQQDLTNKYQDYLNSQNYPYKQLGFMSDMVRGLPLATQSTASMYPQAPGPSTVQTLAGLGGAAYGFGKSGMFGKEGGLMTSYAEGGVTSQQNVEGILPKLSDRQLAQAKKTALARRDVEQAQMIDAEMAERASVRGGLGGAFNQIPEERQETMMAANGGIVAFAGGGTYGKRLESSMETLKGLADKAPVEPTPEQRDEAISARIPMLEKRYGPDITQPYLEETKSKRAGLADQMEKDKGLALAMASLSLLSRKGTLGESRKQQLISGLGEAGQMFIGEVGRLKKENREVDDKLRQSEILLATAQQSRKEGLVNKADTEETRAQDLKRDAFKTRVGIQKDVAQLESGLANTEMQGENSLRVAAANAAAGERNARISAAKETDLHRQTNIRYAALLEAGEPANKQTMAKAAGMAASDLGRFSGDAKAAAAQETLAFKKFQAATEAWGAALMNPKDPAYKKMKELNAADPTGAASEDYKNRWIAAEASKSESSAPAPTAQPAPNVPGSTGTPSRGGPQLSAVDKQALEWAKSNPDDPRAKAIRQRLGMGG